MAQGVFRDVGVWGNTSRSILLAFRITNAFQHHLPRKHSDHFLFEKKVNKYILFPRPSAGRS